MRRALALAVVFASAPAVADDGLPPPPKPLRIEARVDGDTARFSVRYLVRARAEESSDYAIIRYSLPNRGLITAATVTANGQRHVMELVDAEKARADYSLLWEKPPARARKWAVLVETNEYANDFSINITTPYSTTMSADIEVVTATCFHRDARYVAVPTEWLSRLPAAMRAGDDESNLVSLQCADHDRDFGGFEWVKFPARALASRHGGAERIGTYANRTAVGKTSFVKLELNLAAKLSEVPADLVTVILVDASRSTTREELEAQRQTIAAYVRAAPNSRIQVIEYARRTRALLPSWTTASLAAPRLERELNAMQRKNGSNIAAAIAEAGRWLEKTSGTRRIVLFTDENLTTRDEHTHEIEDALPANTLVHVVALGGEGFMRDDDTKLARIAMRTRGMSVRGGDAPMVDNKRVELDATVLVRPIALDHVRVRTPGWEALENTRGASCPEDGDEFVTSFEEGSQCTWWGRGDAVASPFVVEGFLWGERVERVLRADLSRSLDVVRELSAMHVLGEELQKLADGAARAANSVWSFYATWGGEGGYNDRGGAGGYGFGLTCGSGCGNSDDFGHGFGTGTMGSLPDLSIELTRIVQTCKPSQLVDVEVETTLQEIVYVEVKAASADLRTCVEEALWASWLVVPSAPARTITRFSVKPS